MNFNTKSNNMSLCISLAMCKYFMTELQNAKKEIKELKQQLAEKNGTAIPEPAPLKPPPAEPKPSFVFKNNWMQMGREIMQKAIDDTVDGFKKLSLNTATEANGHWKKAVEGLDATDVPSLWTHLLSYFENWKLAHSTRVKEIGSIKGITTRLGIPNDDEFEMFYEKLQDKHKVETNYKQMPLEECKKKFMCSDGEVLTTKKLREFTSKHECGDLLNDKKMVLSFFCYHGNRPQDWCVGYGEENKNDTGYYDPGTHTMHLFGGKTQKEGTERSFKVHEKVAEAISEYRKSKNLSDLESKYSRVMPLVPNSKGGCGNTKKIRDILKQPFMNLGLKNIGPNDLRHLYETHIRYVEKIPTSERLKLMDEIGHDDKTGLKNYGQKYRPMVEWAESVKINENDTPPESDGV